MSFALLMIIILIACYALHYVVAAVYFIVILFMARKPSTKSLAASTIHTTAKDRTKAFPRIANSCEDNNIGHGTKHGNLVAQTSKEAEQYVQQQLNDMHEATLAATGIEFGGYNSDMNLNPAMKQTFDEMHDNNSTWSDSYQDSGWSDPFPDYGWDSSAGFNSGFDSFGSGFDGF